MKTTSDISTRVDNTLSNSWSHTIADPEAYTTWPKRWTLMANSTSNKVVAANLNDMVAATREWHTFAASHHGVVVVDEHWSVHGGQALAQRVTIADIDTAAAIAADERWPQRLVRARSRADHLRTVFAALQTDHLATVLRLTDDYSDTDFHLLCSTATWFASNHPTAAHLTPRQVPVPGVHAKWLNTHHRAVQLLANIDDLGLAPAHPARIHFTYLDSIYLSQPGTRRHDVHALGDHGRPAYQPRIVVISENKDTAVGFRPLPGGIAVEGNGTEGPARMTNVEWISACPKVVYWGDIDAAGFGIVDAYRAAGLDVTTMLMDDETYFTYREFGTDRFPDGRAIPAGGRRLPHLTDSEQSVYNRIIATGSWPRRIEQERIPLAHAERIARGLL